MISGARQHVVPLLATLVFSIWSAFAFADQHVFETDQLNAGLGAVPERLDRSTPQSSVEAFLQAAAEDRFDVAAHLLDLSAIDEADQPQVGPDLARQLSVVLDRKVVVSWSSLLERPDSVFINTSANNPRAGQPRRSLVLGYLDLDDRPVSIRLNRLSDDAGTTAWVFAGQTVDNIPALYELHGPSAFERALPGALRQDAFWGLRWWEVVAVPALTIFLALICRVAWSMISRMAQTTRSIRRVPVRSILLAIRLPLILALLGATLGVATSQVFIMSGLLSNIVEPLVILSFVAAAMVLAIQLLDAIIDASFDDGGLEMSDPDAEDMRARVTTLSALRRGAVILAVVAGTGIVLSSANVFRTLGFSFLASAGALSLVLGFAARDVLGNILASMQISLNRSARVGDTLLFNDHLVTVERITFTFVQLRVWTDSRLIVPVKRFIESEFENLSIAEQTLTRVIPLQVRPDADVSRIRREVETLANDDARIRAKDVSVQVTEQSLFSKTVRVALPCDSIASGWNAMCDMHEALSKFLAEEGYFVDPSEAPRAIEAA